MRSLVVCSHCYALIAMYWLLCPGCHAEFKYVVGLCVSAQQLADQRVESKEYGNAKRR